MSRESTSAALAIAQFLELAEQAGFVVSRGSSSHGFASSTYRIIAEDAELRLVYDGRDQSLALEVNSGPPGPITGWFELFGCTCADGTIVEPTDPETSFLSSVEYGLELMAGREATGA